MDEDRSMKRKESQNGSTGHGLECLTKDKKPVKATVLQKDVSVCICLPVCVCVPENKSD